MKFSTLRLVLLGSLLLAMGPRLLQATKGAQALHKMRKIAQRHKNPRVLQAFHVVRKSQPHLLVKGRLRRRFLTAIRPTKRTTSRQKQRILRARKQLDRIGLGKALREKSLRKALLFLVKEGSLFAEAEAGKVAPYQDPQPAAVMLRMEDNPDEPEFPKDRSGLEKLARAGDPRAQFELGRLLRYHSTPARLEDWQEGRLWLKKAMDSGHAEATFLLANPKEPPLKGDPVDHGRWRERLELAADRGLPAAQFTLGYLLREPSPRSRWGFPEDLSKGADWLRRAAEAGYTAAQYEYASALQTGRGVSRNPDAATMWFTRAADAGHQGAQVTLGRMKRADPIPPLKGVFLSHDDGLHQRSGFFAR
jgi:TPR repeat protein